MAINPTDLTRAGDAHVGSYWAATAGEEVAGAAPVAADMDVELAIIGGGYTGLSTAYHLARDHAVQPHVLEANRIGWGCSPTSLRRWTTASVRSSTASRKRESPTTPSSSSRATTRPR